MFIESLVWLTVPTALFYAYLKTRRQILSLNIAITVVYAIYFLATELYSAFITSTATVVTNICQILWGHKLPWVGRAVLTLPAILLCLIYGEDGLVGVLPVSAFITQRWIETTLNPRFMQKAFFLPIGLWFVYGFLIQSPQVILFQIFMALGLLISLYKKAP